MVKHAIRPPHRSISEEAGRWPTTFDKNVVPLEEQRRDIETRSQFLPMGLHWLRALTHLFNSPPPPLLITSLLLCLDSSAQQENM